MLEDAQDACCTFKTFNYSNKTKVKTMRRDAQQLTTTNTTAKITGPRCLTMSGVSNMCPVWCYHVGCNHIRLLECPAVNLTRC